MNIKILVKMEFIEDTRFKKKMYEDRYKKNVDLNSPKTPLRNHSTDKRYLLWFTLLHINVINSCWSMKTSYQTQDGSCWLLEACFHCNSLVSGPSFLNQRCICIICPQQSRWLSRLGKILCYQYCIKTIFPENCQQNMTATIFERASNGLWSAGTYLKSLANSLWNAGHIWTRTLKHAQTIK